MASWLSNAYKLTHTVEKGADPSYMNNPFSKCIGLSSDWRHWRDPTGTLSCVCYLNNPSFRFNGVECWLSLGKTSDIGQSIQQLPIRQAGWDG